jgi:hypothetical protein
MTGFGKGWAAINVYFICAPNVGYLNITSICLLFLTGAPLDWGTNAHPYGKLVNLREQGTKGAIYKATLHSTYPSAIYWLVLDLKPPYSNNHN